MVGRVRYRHFASLQVELSEKGLEKTMDLPEERVEMEKIMDKERTQRRQTAKVMRPRLKMTV